MRSQAGLHAVRWLAALWCVPTVRGIRSPLPIPALSLGSIGQLLWLEGDLHRREQRYCTEFVEAGV
jgi:hypothetical protein